MIDRIEFNVVQSENFVKAASTDTKKAVKFQSAARRVSLTISMLCM
jgi:t-SNARE complex subunit (syntaxin)